MYRKIYFMGIKGVGMATLAVMAKQAGFIVGGSDVEEEFITDKILKDAGIDVQIGFKKENVEEFFGSNPKEECLFIATAAHEGFENPETIYAKEKGCKVVSHGEAVGLFMSGKLFGRSDIEGISVSGSHGKTTIGGMIAACLTKLGSDPSFTVGTSEIFGIGASGPGGPPARRAAGHYGKGRYFIAEADEYFSESKYDRTPKFLYQKPSFLIINNIDFDHPDAYANIEAVENAYLEFASNLPIDSVLIVNGDDMHISNVLQKISPGPKIVRYGTGGNNDFKISHFNQEGFDSYFSVETHGTDIGRFTLAIPGYHNAKNSLSVSALLIELGISIRDIQRVLPEFLGVARRLEMLGETKDGALIFDDYAHHPEEIRKTLEALRGVYPDKKITLVFQAHTYGRTKALLSEFASSFAGVSELIILPTFASARDSRQYGIDDDREFVERLRLVQPNVKFIESALGVIEYIDRNVKGSDRLVITMGAGDVYKIAYNLTRS